MAKVLATRAAVLAQVAQQLAESRLSQSLEVLYSSFVHMHCNRLLGLDRDEEREVMELLLRTREGLGRAPVV